LRRDSFEKAMGSMEEVTKTGTVTSSGSLQNRQVEIILNSGELSTKHTKGVRKPLSRTSLSEKAPEEGVGSRSETKGADATRTVEPELSPSMIRATKFGGRY
jgi:hypothetical protein